MNLVQPMNSENFIKEKGAVIIKSCNVKKVQFRESNKDLLKVSLSYCPKSTKIDFNTFCKKVISLYTFLKFHKFFIKSSSLTFQLKIL